MRRLIFFSKILLFVFIGGFLSACVVMQPETPNDPYYAPAISTMSLPDKPQNGSLYSHNGGMNLFNDGKASRIGDIITVILQERTTSSKSSNVEVTKENEVDIAPSGSGVALGIQPTIGNLSLNSALTGDREFTGEASAGQSNRLTGDISVTVVDVLPNGTLVIRGEKWLTLNRGNEYIRISGLVRPSDVSPMNTVTSMKIANARITYSGTGELAESQDMGWLTRFFNSPIWPF